MAIHFPGMLNAKKILRRSISSRTAASVPLDIPRGYDAVYVGEKQKIRHVVPISYLNEPLFQDLLSKVEEEFGYEHPMGGLTIPCSEDVFSDLTARLSGL